MNDKEKLKIYDQLREAHRYISVLDTTGMAEEHAAAIEAVSFTLYLAEEHFAKMSD